MVDEASGPAGTVASTAPSAAPSRVLPPVRLVAAAVAIAALAAAVPARSAPVTAMVAPAAISAPADAAAGYSAGPVRRDAVEAELVAERTAIVPGETLRLGLRLAHDPRWHTYWRNAGDSGLPTRLELRLPEGWRDDGIRWPAPERVRVGPFANFGYEGEVVLPVAVTVPAGLPGGRRVRLQADASWLACREVCVPGEARLAIELPVADRAAPSRWSPLFASAAAAAPDPAAALGARWRLDGRAIDLLLPAPPGASAAPSFVFFPYRERVVAAAADQHLHRLPDGRWRIALALSDDADEAALRAAAGDDARLDGLLVVDGRPVELHVARSAAAAPTGERIASAVLPEAATGRGLNGTLGSLPASRPAPGDAATGVTGAGGPAVAEGPAAVSFALLLALAGAVGGGLLLNLMPCVFPVVGLKVLGFVQDASGDARRARRHALAFAAGVVAAFVLLAALMLVLRASGEAVGWGFQLQSPVVVAALALLFVAIGLNFSGVYEVGVSLSGAGGAGRSTGVAGAFGAGLLASVVATPCTAPFMGAAVGFTLAAPPALAMAVFAAIGVGMAAPYVVLGLRPAWLARLPRPGRWMQTLRQALAFPMYATAVWLAWVLGAQLGIDAMLRLGLGAVLVGAAAWWWGRAAGHAASGLLAAALVVLACWIAWPHDDPIARQAEADTDTAPSTLPGAAVPGAGFGAAATPVGQPGGIAAPAGWQPWSPQAVDAARAAGRPVFVDFTAAWCVTCQANKRLVLERDPVRAAFARGDVLLLRADWTRRDPRITAALAEHGRNGVPLYLVYGAAGAPAKVLPELLRADLVLEALGAGDRGG